MLNKVAEIVLILSLAGMPLAVAQNKKAEQSDKMESSVETTNISKERNTNETTDTSKDPKASASTAKSGPGEGHANSFDGDSQQQDKRCCRECTGGDPPQGDPSAPQNYVEYRSGG